MDSNKSKIESFPKKLHSKNKSLLQAVPSMKQTQEFVDELVTLIFPVKVNAHRTSDEVDLKWRELQFRYKSLLLPIEKELAGDIDSLSNSFFSQIPDIYEKLLDDSEMFLKNDPAAFSVEEIMLCYPGFYAIAVHRFANVLYRLRIPVIPRVISEYAHSKTGIDINPGATIGENFYIDHGTGIVIGETTVIGKNVKIYQGVTLGALSVSKGLANAKRHPTIEDNVIVYSGTTILGGNTVIGHDTIIGGNVWLTESVLPNSVVYHKSEVIIRNGKGFNEPINFVI
ncbi:MAG: serine acetyltransferase [Bacteroidales bacterium]|nr:MAG: serine acetyltransferase [Bacteroidales bacterium]